MPRSEGAVDGAAVVTHWFEALADHMGPAYLRYSFTKGTANEVDLIEQVTGLEPGGRVLDVGCGPGRHALELGTRGYEVVGIDVAERFVELGRAAAADAGLDRVSFERGDGRGLGFDSAFDVVISLCQGAFGLTGGPGSAPGPPLELDEPVLAGMARAVRPGGVVVVSAFSAYFQVRHLEPGDDFQAGTGVNRESTAVMDPDGKALDTDLWTTCYTPRELRLLARTVGLEPVEVYGVTPGRYRTEPPDIEQPEFLLVARRPSDDRERPGSG